LIVVLEEEEQASGRSKWRQRTSGDGSLGGGGSIGGERVVVILKYLPIPFHFLVQFVLRSEL